MAGKTDTEHLTAAIRFGLGAGSADMAAMGGDPRGWLRAQVTGPAADAAPIIPAQVRNDFGKFYQSRLAERDALAANDEMLAAEMHKETRRAIVRVRSALSRAELEGLTRAVTTETPFRERLVRFWTNHFSVLPRHRNVAAIAPYFAESAISPHVTGRFEDLLVAAIRHPAIQIYLDNHRSVGPNSPMGLKTSRGLNENLAREILELYTLGSEGGYSQDDIIALATALTGWTLGNPVDPETSFDFVFRADRHEPAAVVVLGKTYPDSGGETAELVLRDLARHPSTARHIATKLARHFVADDPPASAVDRLAAVYLQSGGDLGEVSRALVDLDEARAQLFSKLKQPGDFVVSSLRALDFGMNRHIAALALEHQTAMGQPPQRPPGPQGWYDTAGDWSDPSSLRRRVEWGVVLAARGGDRLDPLAAADRNFGAMLDREARLAIERAPSREEAAAILIASPLFQRR